VRGFDLVKHSYLTQPPVRIAIHVEVLLGHFVDMFVRAFLRNLNHATADGKVAIRVVRIPPAGRIL